MSGVSGTSALDVLRVASAILDAGDVVLRASAEVVVERDDAVVRVGGEHSATCEPT